MTDGVTKRALLIEDDKSLLTAITSILRKRGYEVYTATEPYFCPIYLKHECTCPEGYKCTNILITDVKMPNMTGFEFLKELKSHGCKVQNIAVMSAVREESELKYFESVGCKILGKPFKMNELAEWLDECEKKVDPTCKLSDLPKARRKIYL